ncbi:MAG: ankyrin repeat domain-containing protein, partial [Bryobacterales bacterium]|nr:ankyrin repeat domain-containing protein [Bryobacterales bacterium]
MTRPVPPVLIAALLLGAAACGSDSAESSGPPPAGGRSGFLSERFAEAALQGNTKAVGEMLQLVDVNAVDESGRTMLMLAAFGGHSTTVRVLCENKANPNLRDMNRRTALMFAASGPDARTVEI